MRRLLGFALVALVAAPVALVGLASAPARAGTICPGGSYATASAAVSPGSFVCMGMDGVARGGITKEGVYVKTIPGLSAQMAPQLNQTSSTLSAAGGGPPTNNANTAAVNGNPANNGRIGLGTRVMQNGAAIVSAAFTGYMIGDQLAKVSCSFGLDVLCKPTKNTVVQPNTDVVVTGDAGLLTTTIPANGTVPALTVFQAGGVAKTHFGDTKTAAGETMKIVIQKPTGAPAFTLFIGGASAANPNGLQTGPSQGGQPVRGCPGGFQTAWNGSGWVNSAGQTDASGNYVWSMPSNDTTGCLNAAGSAFGAGWGPIYVADGPGTSGTSHGTKTYALVGDSARPPDVTPNPQRHIVTRNQCLKPDGTSTTTESAPSAPFTESDAEYPEFPAGVPCPAGSTLGGSTTVETTPGLPDKKVTGTVVPQKIIDNQKLFPECLGGECRLTLVKIGPAGTDVGDCFAKVGRCTEWFTDPAKPDNYQCKYGLPGAQKLIGLAECNVYAPTFDRALDPTKAPYGDPDTGAEPGTDTGNGDPDPDPSGDPLPGESGGADCWPSGWGIMNPLNWVLQPVKCALVWAFVPSESVVTDTTTQAKTDLGSAGVGPWVTAMGGLLGKLGGSGGGCAGPEVTFPLTNTSLHPFGACTSPMSTVAHISYAFSTVLVVVFGAMAGMRAVGSAFGYELNIGTRQRAES